MRVTIKKWGNSASIRIPAAIMQAAHLNMDQPVDVREEKGRIVVEPLQQPEFRIESLVSAITNKNRHTEIDFGGPVGKEIW